MIKIEFDKSKYEINVDRVVEAIYNIKWYASVFKNLSLNKQKIILDIVNNFEFLQPMNKKIGNLNSTELIKQNIDKQKLRNFLLRKDFENIILEFERKMKLLNLKNNSLDLILKKIFNYDGKIYNDGLRHKLLISLDIRVCPYCQRQYITNYKEDNKDKTTADLDHFYSQEKYPYLALSLYNFIPSCQICNSRMKGKKEFSKDTHIYPYEESFVEEYKFSSTNIHLLNLKDNKVELKRNRKFTHLDTKFYDRIEKNIEDLKLDKVYEYSHNEYLKDMIENIQSYPSSKLAEIDDLFQKNGISLLPEEKKKLEFDLQNLVLKPYKDRVDKREPLAKLTKDILEEYGIKI